MHCLWCDEKILPEVTWVTFLIPQKIEVACEECKENFSELNSAVCVMCNRRMEREGETCFDCERWQRTESSLERNVSVYEYTPFMQEIVSKWKYRGDYVLVELFREGVLQRFDQTFDQLDNLVLVPIPLSEERFRERGFNQAEALARMLNKEVVYALQRRHTEKQSKKSRMQRMTSENPFHGVQSVSGNVVLVDDLYTTGRTIHHAAETLKANGAEAVYSFTLIRG